MSLALLVPLGLVALASFAVPLLIHLIRRPEQEILDFAALRWLRESLRPRRRLRLDDFWLLLARLVLLGLMALLLAAPVIKGEWRGPRRVIAVSTDADPAAARARITDNSAVWLWLTPGFPSVDTPITRSDLPQASLLRELDASLSEADHLTVVVADQIDGLDAQRMTLGHSVDWLEVAAASRSPEPLRDPKTYVVSIRSDAVDATRGLRYVQAATSVWKTPEGDNWKVDDEPASVPLPGKLDALIWMSRGIPDAVFSWIRQGGRALTLGDPLSRGNPIWRDQQGQIIASEEVVEAGVLIRLRGPLTPSNLPNLLDADFPRRLQSLLLPAPKPSARAYSREVKPVLVTRTAIERVTSLSAILGLLIALVFLIERVLATRRRAQ
ncbi:MAG: BatA domain-containing protein [Dokdonella sp.]